MRIIDADAYLEHAIHEAEAMPKEQGESFVTLTDWLVDKSPTIELCEDAVSRLGAIKGLKPIMEQLSLGLQSDVATAIWNLPSVAPSRPKGRWIEETYIDGHTYCTCSECLHVRIPDNFCPNCGADMKGANDGNK